MPKKLIRFDWAIKKLLRSKANFVILEGFLSELLKKDIKIINILESEGNKETETDKYNRVDVAVKDENDEIIIIEVQIESEWDFLSRLFYGISKVVTENMKEGFPYHKVKKVFSIGIIYFDYGQGKDYIYHGNTEFKGIHFNDVLRLNTLQKKKYKRENIKDVFPEYFLIKVNKFDDIAKNTLDEWIYFLKNEEIKDEFTAKGLDEAREQLDEMKMSDEEKSIYKKFKEDLHYQASMFDSSYGAGHEVGFEKGIEKGIEKGSKEKAIEIAKKLKKQGLDINSIIETTGLSELELEQIFMEW